MHSLCFATENAIKLQIHVDFHGLNTKKKGEKIGYKSPFLGTKGTIKWSGEKKTLREHIAMMGFFLTPPFV